MALHRKCQKSIALNVAITDVCCCIKNLNNKTYSCAEVVFIFDKLIQNSSWKKKTDAGYAGRRELSVFMMLLFMKIW